MKPIAILYEHPEWFRPLFAELDRRGLPYEPIHASELVFDPGDPSFPYSLVVNRMSPSAWRRGNGDAIFHTLQYLAHLDGIGAPVVNGHRAFQYEISKARQLSLFRRLGVAHPRSRVISRAEQAVAAADGLRYPVVVKPNIGGSGGGIVSFENQAQLEEATASDDLWLGLDHTAIVQEQLPPAGDAIVRVEILDGKFLYAIKLQLTPGTFNLCPADYCRPDADGVSDRGVLVEAIDPPPNLVTQAKEIVSAAGMDLGGVEYLVDARDGEAYFYDLNALSNFVADAPNVVGFDPFVDLVDLLVARLEERRVA